MNPFFLPQEYHARRMRAAEIMRRYGLDALFVTAETNVYYFSGYRAVAPWMTTTRSNFCLIPANGNPILIVHEVWLGGARADSPIQDIRSFTETTQLPLGVLMDSVRDCGLAHGRIGAELGYEQRLGMSFNDFSTLQGALPEVNWSDGAEALWELRMIKSPAEIELMRRSCQITERAYETCYPRLSPRLTEAELAANLRATIASSGGEFGFMTQTFVPEGYEAMSRMPTFQTLQPGTLIWTDLGAVYGGYWSDFGRAAVIGGATDRQKRLWQGVHEVTQAGVAAIRPGRPIREVVDACGQEARELGLTMNFASGRIGHGLGLMLTEPPHMASYDDHVLETGNVITLEPGIVGPEGVYIVEQDIAVVETGADVLSNGRWQLWEI
jgi:Xaa-Pro aminopeptidase